MTETHSMENNIILSNPRLLCGPWNLPRTGLLSQIKKKYQHSISTCGVHGYYKSQKLQESDVGVLKGLYRFLAATSFQKQNLIPLPLNVGWTPWCPSKGHKVAEITVGPRLAHTREFSFLSFKSPALGKRLPCHEDIRVWESHWGEPELSPNSQHHLITLINKLPRKEPLRPQGSLQMPRLEDTSCLQPRERFWSRTACLVHSQISGPQELWVSIIKSLLLF